MEKRDRSTMSDTLKKIDSLGIRREMTHDIITARNTVARQNTYANAKNTILDFDKATISEIRSYDHPPKILQRVVQAAVMLLGEDERSASVNSLPSLQGVPENMFSIRRNT